MKTRQAAKHIIEQILLFAVQIVNTYKCLANEKEYVLSKQLLRSGTAVGALAREAKNAESKPDFIHKMEIAQKECDVSIYRIELLEETNYLNEVASSKKQKASELLRIIRAIILSTKKSIHNS